MRSRNKTGIVNSWTFPAVRQGEALTDQETQILSLIGQGKSHAEIAKAMSYGESTTYYAMGKIKKKLGANGSANAVYLAMKKGINL